MKLVKIVTGSLLMGLSANLAFADLENSAIQKNSVFSIEAETSEVILLQPGDLLRLPVTYGAMDPRLQGGADIQISQSASGVVLQLATVPLRQDGVSYPKIAAGSVYYFKALPVSQNPGAPNEVTLSVKLRNKNGSVLFETAYSVQVDSSRDEK